MGRILALDIGSKRTGIAVSDNLKLIANGLSTIPTHQLIDFISKYIKENDVERLVIGKPIQMDNNPSKNMNNVNSFINLLKKKLPDLPYELVDERFTSVLAQRTILEAGLKKKARQDKALVDEVSAVIILQSYLEMIRPF